MFEVEGFTKVFPVGTAVDELSLKIAEGEVLGLVGASGSGKTTLGKCLLHLIPIETGIIKYRGKDISKFNRQELFSFRKEVQMIFQSPKSSLNPVMTVGELIEEPLIIHNIVAKKERKGEVERLLGMVKLTPTVLKMYPHELSGGMRQRVSIARALACRPKFIIFDEAISSLDASMQMQIVCLLMELKEKYQLTYLFISHDLVVVQKISTRTAVMRNGTIVELAPTEELFSEPSHPYTKRFIASIDPNEEIDPSYFSPPIDEHPTGCACSDFCPKAEALCKVAKPPMSRVSNNHFTNCHFP